MPKISDFGLAKKLDEAGATHTGDVMGTPSYMAPEQARGDSKQATPATDVYALGAILYECLTGRPPFKAPNPLDTLLQILTEEVVPPTRLQPKTPCDLETVCLKCLSKEPHRRYASAQALADDLRAFLEGAPIQARPAGRVERLWRASRRHPGASLGAVVATFAVLTALVLLVWLAAVRDGRARDLEAQQRELQGKQTELEAALQQSRTNFRASRRQAALLALDRGLALCDDGDAGRGLLFLTDGLDHAVAAGDAALELYLRRSLSAWRRQRVPLRALLAAEARPRWGAAPDGSSLLTVDSAGLLRRWQAASGLPLAEPLSGPGLTAVAFSPDGRFTATAGQGGIQLRQAATLQPTSPLLEAAGEVVALAFSPDGAVLAAGDSAGVIRRWGLPAGRLLGEPLRTEGAGLRWLRFLPSGSLCAVIDRGSSGRDRHSEALIWDAGADPSRVRTLRHGGPITALAANSTGSLLLTAAALEEGKKGEVRLWSAADGLARGAALTMNHPVTAAAFHPKWARVFLAQREGDTKGVFTVDAYDCEPEARDGLPLKRLHEEGPVPTHAADILTIAFAPDGSSLVTGSRDGVAQLWEADTGRRLGESLEHQAPVEAVAFLPGGDILTWSTDRVLRVWETRLRKPDRFAFPAGAPAEQVLLPGGRALRPAEASVAGGVRTGVVVLDLAAGKPGGPPLPLHGPLGGVALSPDGLLAVTRVGLRQAQIFEVASGAAVGPPLEHRFLVTAVAFSPDGSALATGSGDADGGEARLWSCRGQPLGDPLPHPGQVRAVALNADRHVLLSACWDGATRLWNTRTGQQLAALVHQATPVTTVLLNREATSALTLAEDAPARISRRSGGRWTEVVPDARKAVRAAYSQDGARVAVAYARRDEGGHELRVWDTVSGEPVGPPMVERAPVSSLAFSPDGGLLLVGGGPTARLWDVTAGRPVGPPLLTFDDSNAVQAEFASEGRGVWIGSGKQAVYWPLPEPLRGEPEQLRLWAQVGGGLEFDGGGGVRALDPPSWLQRRQRLSRLGGLPPDEPTMTAPLQDRRPRLDSGLLPPGLSAAGG